MEWNDCKLVKTGILFRLGGPLAIRHAGKEQTHATQKGQRIEMTP